MQYRKLGKTGMEISAISLGTWQVGGKWGEPFNNANADKILNEAVDKGINFIDTADVYSDGESEKAVGKLIRTRSEKIFVATKCGRQLNPHVNAAYQPAVLRKFVENSLRNMGLETLDLIQLHCPPTDVYYRPEIFELFDKLKQEGKIQNLGISVERVEEALKGIEFDNVTTVQIIFNLFRQRPAELFFKEAAKKNIGIIVRVPLASGLLTGKFTQQSTFAEGDHRFFNRNGEAFDKGETFSGVDYNTGLAAVEALKAIFPHQPNLAPIALQWILQFKEVSCIIPGASRPEQLVSNLEAFLVPEFTQAQLTAMQAVYDAYIKKQVHQLW
ncbi:aldo/keto reductase [Parasediminibacterium sp. JCM 36343]|uniref:aldo/keto reductase n=1 Tax=Parasediminibacterium sp. JCM 36343 TaxID=3374279 RepID=UPI00397E79A4